MPSLQFRNYTLAIVVKKRAKADIKLLFSCQILLEFFTFRQIFCSGL